MKDTRLKKTNIICIGNFAINILSAVNKKINFTSNLFTINVNHKNTPQNISSCNFYYKHRGDIRLIPRKIITQITMEIADDIESLLDKKGESLVVVHAAQSISNDLVPKLICVHNKLPIPIHLLIISPFYCEHKKQKANKFTTSLSFHKNKTVINCDKFLTNFEINKHSCKKFTDIIVNIFINLASNDDDDKSYKWLLE